MRRTKTGRRAPRSRTKRPPLQTDTICYRLLQTLPEVYFELLGLPGQTAADYTFAAEELKQTARRLDGVFLPQRPGLPVHFIEVYFYREAGAYANLFGKVFVWLETHGPAQHWHATLLFANRALAPAEERPYQALLTSDQVTRLYLDELPPAGPHQVGLGILQLLATTAERAVPQARRLLAEVQAWKKPVAARRQVIDLIETVVLQHFPDLSRKELETMLQMRDLRETKVYQEALAEGREEGRAEGREEVALRLLARGLPVSEVVTLTSLTVARVRRLKKVVGKRK